MRSSANVLATTACVALALVACGRTPAPPSDAPSVSTMAGAATASTAVDAIQSDSTRAWLVRMLTCGDRDFLRSSPDLQHAQLSHMPGVTCEPAAGGVPLQCAITPPLRLGQAEIGWFVIGAPQFDLAPIIVPAPQDALRNAMSSGAGALSPGTDLGDTTVQCALTEDALAPGTIAGTVQRKGDPAAGVRVCAFELAEGVPTCAQTAMGERTFRIENLVRGDYLVYAIPGDAPDVRVGYTDCEAEATEAACEHELKVVEVGAGRVTDGIDPADLRTLDEAADWPSPPPMQ